MSDDYPSMHHSLSDLPDALHSMKEIEDAANRIINGSVLMNHNRAQMEQVLVTQICYRLPLGWTLYGGTQIGKIEKEMGEVWYNIYLAVLRHDFMNMNRREADPACVRFKLRLLTNKLVEQWYSESPSIPKYTETGRFLR